MKSRYTFQAAAPHDGGYLSWEDKVGHKAIQRLQNWGGCSEMCRDTSQSVSVLNLPTTKVQLQKRHTKLCTQPSPLTN